MAEDGARRPRLAIGTGRRTRSGAVPSYLGTARQFKGSEKFMCDSPCHGPRQAPLAAAISVSGSTLSAAGLVATGTPTLDALALIAGAGAAGAASVRLGTGRTLRAVLAGWLSSNS